GFEVRQSPARQRTQSPQCLMNPPNSGARVRNLGSSPRRQRVGFVPAPSCSSAPLDLARLLPRLLWIALLCATPIRAQDEARLRIEDALRRYFAAGEAGGPELQATASVARGHEDLLVEVLRSKSFVLSPAGPVARHGTIDASDRFRELAPDERTDNDALFFGPGPSADL